MARESTPGSARRDLFAVSQRYSRRGGIDVNASYMISKSGSALAISIRIAEHAHAGGL